MEIQANGLTAIVNDDGSVDFVDADGTMQYRIGIPYMQDANHEVLNDIEVTATLNGDVWTVTYTPNEEWLTSEERAYPILLDPSVTTNEYSTNITDTYVYEGNTANHSSEQHMYIGVKSGKVYRTYIKIEDLPVLDSTAPILSATMQLSFASGTTTGKTTQVYKVSGSWNSSTLTYASQPDLLWENLLSTCNYDPSIQYLTFDLTNDYINLYDEFIAAYNHGYVVKYAYESDVNPDYNMFCSMEHTNVAKRPVITINYGYVLPSTLTNGGIYAFQNYETKRFMSVECGEDANDVSVITEAVDETETSFVLLPQNLFKLEYIPSTGAYYLRAMCSSNGTNRVLDVVKYNGYPDYGSTVQIYNPTDSLAQHWLIIATEENRFKIVLRNAPELMLSEDTWMETVELRSNEDEWYQEWTIYNDDGHMVNTPYNTSIENDIYYFNNLYYGKYLNYFGGSIYAISGFVDNYGDYIRWKVTHVGNNTYTIQPLGDLTKYLHAYTDELVWMSTPSTLSNEYLWEISLSSSTGGMLIQNVATQNYLGLNSENTLALTSSIGNSGTQTYNECVWRIASVSYFAGKELTNASTISPMIIDVGETRSPTINRLPGNALWSSPTDFTYSSALVSRVSVENGVCTGNSSGVSTIIATHKVTGVSFVFSVVVGNQPTHSIINYVDVGYRVRFEDYPDISEYYEVVCEKFENIFGLDCDLTYSTITSSADYCKAMQFDYVTADTLDEECPHSPDHLTTSALRSGMSGGTNTKTQLLWTGHILTDNTGDRSNSYGNYVVITPTYTVENIDDDEDGINYETLSVSKVRTESISTLMHELSHQLGAPDHYCYDDGEDEGDPCSNKYCDRCVFGMMYERECIMSRRCNIETEQESTLYCPWCLEIINNHLSGHHQ